MKAFVLHFIILFGIFSMYACQENPSRHQAQEKSLIKTDIKLQSKDSILTEQTLPNAPKRITRNIKTDHDGNLLIAAFEDIILFDGTSFKNLPKPSYLSSFDAFDVLEDLHGNIWIASTHYGAFRYDGNSFTQFTTENGLADNRIMCIYEDRKGNIWMGSQGGLTLYDGTSFQNFTTRDGLSHNDVNTILEDRTGKIWIGTRGNLCILEPGKGISEIATSTGTFFNNVWSVIEDQEGDIWIGGTAGLWRYKDSSSIQLSSASVTSIHEDPFGNIWFAHGASGLQKSGFSQFKQTTLASSFPKPTPLFLGNQLLFDITSDQTGRIWVGGLNGVLAYDGLFTKYSNPDVADK